MRNNISVLMIMKIGVVTGFMFKCPTQSEWRQRANAFCLSEDKYVCLLNLLDKKHYEDCSGSELSNIGSKLVFQPLFNHAPCNTNRYQSFIFNTFGNSECAFLKSSCNEEGQVLYSNGSSIDDVSCRCDYTKGYAFVKHPRNPCFCKPVEEDCSCFRVHCKKLSSDYQCISDGNLITKTICPEQRSLISVYRNVSTVEYIEGNLSEFSKAKIIFTVAVAVFCVLLAALGIHIFVLPRIVTTEVIQSEYEDGNHRFIHELIQKGECGKHHFARVILIGKQGVGKTSLMRRLLWENKKSDMITKSTDGVEIRKCNINVANGKWSKSDEIGDDLTRLIRQVYTDKERNVQTASGQHIRENSNAQGKLVIDTEDPKNVIVKEYANHDTIRQNNKTEVCGQNSPIESNDKENNETFKRVHANIDKNKNRDNDKAVENIPSENIRLEHSLRNEKRGSQSEHESDSDSENNETIDLMTADIVKSYRHIGKDDSTDILAFCWLWDFAGQKEFYATHQVFLSRCAVYLLVTDIPECSSSETIWTDIEDSAQFVRFWFDAIHCYSSCKQKGRRLDPPIILVCTNEDKFKDLHDREKRKERYMNELISVLSTQKKKDHLRNIYFVSNIEDDDSIFEKIRQDISLQAKTMDDWGKNCPLKWLLFQQVLAKIKEINVPISTTTKLFKIAKHSSIGITSNEEFIKCLQYCNNIGTLIFFDEDNLKEHVILDPKWLVDAFRCLVSDKIERVVKLSDDWQKLKDTGELTHSLITLLFKKEPKLKFAENTKHLIEVMKRFDIIVNLRDSATLYMPCMMESCSFQNVRKQFMDETASPKSTSWLCLDFEFLPPAFFNHILAWYIKQYNVSVIPKPNIHTKRNALYRQIGVFDLEGSQGEKLVVCEGLNVIALQVWDWRNTDSIYDKLRGNLVQFVDTLKERYKLQICYTVTFKCEHGDFSKNRETMNKLIANDYFCLEHKKMHSSDDLVKPWGIHVEKPRYPEKPRNPEKEKARQSISRILLKQHKRDQEGY